MKSDGKNNRGSERDYKDMKEKIERYQKTIKILKAENE
jgi:hypothetical protein